MPGLSRDPMVRARQVANLHAGMSDDPAARARQLAALRPGSHVAHGAHGETAIAPLRERYLGQLADEFPGEDERLLLIQAQRLARLELLSEYEARRGPILNHRTGVIRPSSEFLERTAGAFERQHAILERRAVERRNATARTTSALDAITAELTAPSDCEDGQT